jgi:hypothetical protein
MSVRRCQREVSSAEFGEWLAEWQLEAEESQGHGAAPDDDELEAKMNAWMARANAARR